MKFSILTLSLLITATALSLEATNWFKPSGAPEVTPTAAPAHEAKALAVTAAEKAAHEVATAVTAPSTGVTHPEAAAPSAAHPAGKTAGTTATK